MKKYLPVILIIIAIGIFFVFIDPQYSEVQDLLSEKEDNATMLDLAKDLQEKRDRLRNSFNNISTTEKEQLAKLLPDTVDNVRLILDINNIAENYGVVIRNISVESDANEADFVETQQIASSAQSNSIGTITLSFSMVSTYDVFIQFMKDLEEALRIVDIRRLDIQSTNDSNFLNFNITLDTYWLR